MASPSGVGEVMNAALRITFDHMNDEGETPSKSLDEVHTLSGYQAMRSELIKLSASASDQSVTFTDAVAVILVARDYPFSLRLAAGETLMENLRGFVAWAHDTDEGVLETSVLLSGNGDNTALIEAWVIEKP